MKKIIAKIVKQVSWELTVLTLIVLGDVVTTAKANEAIDPNQEWRRSNPDIVVYLPKEGKINDGDNEHFLVFESPRGTELLAMWTQSTVEAHGDNHIVLARSKDGINWSDPLWLVGTHQGTSETQASWGFPIVSRQGRIYCFYTKSAQGVRGGETGIMGGLYSDDNGYTWNTGPDIIVPPSREDPSDLNSKETSGFIVWQNPIRDRKGRLLAGYTCNDDKSYFMRFDNIDQGPDIKDIQITWLPQGHKGLQLPRYVHPKMIGICAEPSTVLLPDGRLFVTMRTKTGNIWYSVSDDDGDSWREPAVLRYKDYAEPIKHPLAPCPVYRLKDGRYLLLFHNNDYYARSVLYGEPMPQAKGVAASPIFRYRRPAYLALGTFRPGAHQPIWFSQPQQILDTDGVVVGPKRTNEIATYTSLTEWKNQRILWYPDRKYYLLGKFITEPMLNKRKKSPDIVF